MMTAYQRKLYTLASAIYCELSMDDGEWHQGIIIKRHILRRIIQKILKITSANAITKWIDTLLSEEIITLNPNSSLSPVLKIFKPSNDTRYFIDTEKCERLHAGIVAYREKKQRERHMQQRLKDQQQKLFPM